MSSRVRVFARRAITGAVGTAGVTAAVAATGLLSAAPSAAATAATGASTVVRVAASKAGDPYVYGAAGPGAFDCSGLVQYSFAAAGMSLPRTAQGQYNATTHIAQSSKAPGDIIFFVDSGGRVYHDGIYAGNNAIWVAPKPGDRVKLERIWTSAYRVGRVGGAVHGTARGAVRSAAPARFRVVQASYRAPGRRTLAYGSSGNAVAVLQRDLHITADGVFGPRTRAAVISFQRTHRLLVDGIVGSQTWGALDRFTA